MQPRKKQIRNKYFDYTSNGAYLVTVLCENRSPFFGRIVTDDGGNAVVKLSEIGEIAVAEWQRMEERYSNVMLDEFVFMPDHMHAIVWLQDQTETNLRSGKQLNAFGKMISGSLSSVINRYKGTVTIKCRDANLQFKWHPRFHDNIIRSETQLENSREYIRTNPQKWLEKKGRLSGPGNVTPGA